MLDYVAEDEHQSMGRVDGRIARWRGWVRVRPSPEQVSQVQRQGTRSVLENDTLLLPIRLFGVSFDYFFFFFFFLAHQTKKKKKEPSSWREKWIVVTNEIISNEWDCYQSVRYCRYVKKEKYYLRKQNWFLLVSFQWKYYMSYDIVIRYSRRFENFLKILITCMFIFRYNLKGIIDESGFFFFLKCSNN